MHEPPRGRPGNVCPASAVLRAPMCALLAWLLAAPASASASSIGISPTLIEVKAGAVSGLRVRNGDAEQPVSVQARVLRWRQDESGDVYAPAEGVVVSPPVTRIMPGGENLIRIVRTAKYPVAGEEGYRLLVDELPEPGAAQEGVINMLVQHSVPVFFAAPGAAPAQPQWQIERAQQDGGAGNVHGWRIKVNNLGDKRLRLANLHLYDSNGALVAQRQGLVGYVLGRASMGFFVPADTGLIPVVSP